MSTLSRGVAAVRALLMPAVVSLLVFHAAGPARAAQQLTISIPPTIEVEPSTETPLSIRVLPEHAVPRQVMVLIRGLPSTVALSEGRLFDSGVWAIRVADLPQLKLASPARAGARNQLAISAVSLDGSVLAEAAATLVVTAPRMAVARPVPPAGEAARDTRPAVVVIRRSPDEAVPAAQPDTRPQERAEAAPASVRKVLTPEEMQRVEMFMAKAAENLQNGNVNVARLFYKRAVNLGWSPAALALGSTYDAAELERIGTVGGIQPDAKLAAEWYEKARELGAPEAQERLLRLGAR